eukprot:357442-Chlamydomonas_euryale.AAC.4
MQPTALLNKWSLNFTRPRMVKEGRGTNEAMFTLWFLVNAVAPHQLPAAPDEVTPTLAIAFVDFTKAYDSIGREAL